MKSIIALLLTISLSSCFFTPGYYRETELKKTHSNMYEVRTFIWHYGNIAASHFTFGPEFEGIYFMDLPEALKEHNVWADSAVSKLKQADALY